METIEIGKLYVMSVCYRMQGTNIYNIDFNKSTSSFISFDKTWELKTNEPFMVLETKLFDDIVTFLRIVQDSVVGWIYDENAAGNTPRVFFPSYELWKP